MIYKALGFLIGLALYDLFKMILKAFLTTFAKMYNEKIKEQNKQ